MKKFLFILLPLILGGIIYLFFHKPNLLLHRFFIVPNYYETYKNDSWLKLVTNYVPDIMWAISVAAFLHYSLSNSFGKYKTILIVSIVACSEIIQLFFPKLFRFDVMDLILMVVFSWVTLKYINEK
jgi:hypothetical protein